MELKIANHSHYPRIGDKPEQQKLRKAYHQLDRKSITEDQFKEIKANNIRVVIGEQEKEGLDAITDGLIEWNDPISHFMRSLKGVKITGLLRFFDTNSYFRQPLITGPLSRERSVFKDELTFLKNETKRLTKLVLTGPYTIALHSNIQTPHYKTVEALADDIAVAMAEELKELQSLGIAYIQIDEPGYLKKTPNWEWAKKNIATLAAQKGKSILILSTFFGDAAPVFSELESLPVDVLGVDLTYSPSLFDQLKSRGSKKVLQLGILDGRNTKLEDPKEIAKKLHELGRQLKASELWITTSCGLEFLSRERAQDKLHLLKQVRSAYNETGQGA